MVTPGVCWRHQIILSFTLMVVLVETLNFGDFYETILTNSADISASNAIIVMQYSNGDDWDPNLPNNGDPFMMLIPPTEQFMDQYTFATPSEGYIYNYVTVTIETTAIGTLVLDGATVDPGLFTPIGTTGYSGAGIPINAGSHTIQIQLVCPLEYILMALRNTTLTDMPADYHLNLFMKEVHPLL